jgi:hypothetical protein
MPTMPLAPITLQVSPRFTRRVNLLVLAPLMLMSATVVALFALLPGEPRLPLPFAAGMSRSAFVIALGAFMLAIDLLAVAVLRAHTRRLTGKPWLVVTTAGVELPQHALQLPWAEVTAIVQAAVANPVARVHLLLRPAVTRQWIADQLAATGRSKRGAWWAALNVPLITDQRMGVRYIPLVPECVGLKTAELAELLERYRAGAERRAPAA